MMSKLLDIVHFKDASNWSVAHLLESQFNYNKEYELVRIGNFLTRNRNRITIEDHVEYKRVTIRMKNKGITLRDRVMGRDIGTKKQFIIKKGQFLLSKIDARNGAFGLATDEVDGAIITADFFAYEIDKSRIEPYFLVLLTTTKQFQKFAQGASSGTTGRQRINEKAFLDVKIPLPSLDIQKKIIQDIIVYENKIKALKEIFPMLLNNFNKDIFRMEKKNNSLLNYISFQKLKQWSVSTLINDDFTYNKQYSLEKIKNFIIRNKTKILIDDNTFYTRVTIRSKNNGVAIRDRVLGKNIGTKNQYCIKEGQFLLSKIDARNGAFGIVTKELNNAIITADFFAYDIDENKINPYFLNLITTTQQFIKFSQASSTGTTNRQRLNEKKFLEVEIPLPTLEEQNQLIMDLKDNLDEQMSLEIKRIEALKEFEEGIFSELKGSDS
jgi:restriction endonuclease S subunit